MRTATDKLLNRVQRPDAYEEFVISSGGVPIVLSVWRGQPDQATVVFLPGTMTHPLFYEELLDELNRAGFTVVGVHSQGHGKSPRTRHPLTFARIVANAQDAVEWARREFPGTPIAVLGSSQGSIVAMALASAGELDIVIAHNLLDPRLASSVVITRFPNWLRHIYPVVILTVRGIGRLAPRIRVPFDAYLDITRVCRHAANAEYLYTDPLGRRAYPLGFIATLFSADLSGMRAGLITCPILVVTGRGDPLFPLSYTRQVYESIVSPAKELLILNSQAHLLFNEDMEAVLPPLISRLASLRTSR